MLVSELHGNIQPVTVQQFQSSILIPFNTARFLIHYSIIPLPIFAATIVIARITAN